MVSPCREPLVKSVVRVTGLEADAAPDFLHGDVGDLCRDHHPLDSLLLAPLHSAEHKGAVDAEALRFRSDAEEHALAFLRRVDAEGCESDGPSVSFSDEDFVGDVFRDAGPNGPGHVSLVGLLAIEPGVGMIVAKISFKGCGGD